MSVIEAPGNNCATEGLTDKDVTGMPVPVTLTAALRLPSSVVAVTCAVPAPVMVSRPLEETVATAGLLLFQITFRLVALVGVTVADSCWVLPTFKLTTEGLTLMPVTFTTGNDSTRVAP